MIPVQSNETPSSVASSLPSTPGAVAPPGSRSAGGRRLVWASVLLAGLTALLSSMLEQAGNWERGLPNIAAQCFCALAASRYAWMYLHAPGTEKNIPSSLLATVLFFGGLGWAGVWSFMLIGAALLPSD